MPSKKFFPRNARPGNLRGQKKTKVRFRTEIEGTFNQGRNLRHEFDNMMRMKHTLLSDDELHRLWKELSILLLKEPLTPLEEHINTITQAHKLRS